MATVRRSMATIGSTRSERESDGLERVVVQSLDLDQVHEGEVFVAIVWRRHSLSSVNVEKSMPNQSSRRDRNVS